jgi:flagellar hook-associated protein 3 FlgL
MSGAGAVYNNLLHALATQSQSLARLQEQISTGARVSRASDDPSAAGRILGLRAQDLRAQTYSRNLDTVMQSLENEHSVLTDASSALTRAQELITQASTGTYNSSSRSALAGEVDSILEQLVSEVNSQTLGRYVFGGDNTTTAPYAVERRDGKIIAVRYQGSRTDAPSPVSEGVAYSRLVVGDSVFRANDRQSPVFLGETGAGAGGATSNIRGMAWLTVSHTATTYNASSQVAASATSARQDTIIGSHSITIASGGTNTIRLDDGDAVAFNGSETDLVLRNASGAEVRVNMAGWSNATGTYTVQASGRLSLDDGATSAALNFADNNAVTDSRTGELLYVNGSSVTKTGLEPVRAAGTGDVFNTLIMVRDTLTNERSLSEQKNITMLDESLKSVREVMETVTTSLTSLGGRLQAVDRLSESLNDRAATSKEQADSLQNVDIAAVTAELARVQNLYNMTLTASGKLMTLSLLDYL